MCSRLLLLVRGMLGFGAVSCLYWAVQVQAAAAGTLACGGALLLLPAARSSGRFG